MLLLVVRRRRGRRDLQRAVAARTARQRRPARPRRRRARRPAVPLRRRRMPRRATSSAASIEEETNRPLRRAPASVVERAGMMIGRAVASAVAVFDLRLVLLAGAVPASFGHPLLDAAAPRARPAQPARPRARPAPTARSTASGSSCRRSAASPRSSVPPRWRGGSRRRWRRYAPVDGSHVPRRRRGLPREGPGLPRREAPGRLGRHRSAGGRRAARVRRLVARRAVRGGVPRARLARRVRRRWVVGARAGDHRRGVRPRRRADRRAQRRVRHPDARQHAARVGHRGAEAPLPAADPVGRGPVVPGLLRAQRRVRPRQPGVAGDARRRPVDPQRAEDLDVRRAPRRPHLHARPHRSRRAEAQGHLVPARRHAPAGHRGAPDQDDLGGERVQRGLLHRRRVPEGRTSSAASTTAGRSP